MKLEISGKHIDVGDALRHYVDEKITAVLRKYFDRAVEAKVTFSRDAHLMTCDCLAHLATGLIAQASAKDTEIYAAADMAIARLEKQLRRYKRRLRDHHHKRKEPVALVEASTYVLQGDFEESVGDESEVPAEFWSPAIIAEDKGRIPRLSVGEAVMQMELKGAEFLLFINDARQRLNAVYRRDDGNIGWIDPPGMR